MRRLVLLFAVAALGLACDADSDKGTQPAPDVTTFEQGDFGAIPLLARSEPVTPRHEEEGTVSQSFVVRNVAPENVLEFYELELSEFTVVSQPEAIGNHTFRGSWQLDERVLIVSASLAPTAEGVEEFENVDAITQYSLSLSPGRG